MPKLKRPQIIRHEDEEGFDILLFGKDGREHGWFEVRANSKEGAKGLMIWLFNAHKPSTEEVRGEPAIFTVTRETGQRKPKPDKC